MPVLCSPTFRPTSLVISNGKWIWNRGGMGFINAVETVLGSRAAPLSYALSVERPELPPQKQLTLPKVSRYATYALNYLLKRGISADVVSRCIQDGLLYEGRYNGAAVFPYTETQVQANESKRGKKIKVTSPKQKNLNDKNAKRYFVQLAESNFSAGDLILHLTYENEFMPGTYEESLKMASNYLRRVEYQRGKVRATAIKIYVRYPYRQAYQAHTPSHFNEWRHEPG